MSEERRRTALSAGIDWAWAIGVQRRRLLEHERLAAASAKDRLIRMSTEATRIYTHVDRHPFIELRADKHFMLIAPGTSSGRWMPYSLTACHANSLLGLPPMSRHSVTA